MHLKVTCAIYSKLFIYTFNDQKAQTLPTGVNMKAISENQIKYINESKKTAVQMYI